ncbi:hypothetical protein BT93_L1293 [Corymbia citriodora subsp. variegata]|uniref:DUF4220 domain-containing protein n=1 Tax=Corymbia citriodora subsp. variegata TaxID=360336 RepID=A0A8T0CPC0_CORYI|nr:hypothetical protein BT93_L1293 [Corymbia citriodora subsp. variegata]
MAFNPIPSSIRKVWDTWNLRGFIILSLSLQTILIFFAPSRKRTANMSMMFVVWSAYLLADWAAAFAVGLISNSQVDDPTLKDNGDLLAFWAPFLLVHLGGPDTITAFALEDNALWLRHLLGLLFQVFAAAYVFLQTLPYNKLLVPTILMLLAGLIKYAERTRALYLASLKTFKESMLKDPDPGPNYAKLMDEYSSRKEAQRPAIIKIIGEPDRESKTIIYEGMEEVIRSESDVVRHAYHFFEIFKGLIVDLIFTFHEWHESRQFFQQRNAEEAFKVIAIELNFMYDVLYTKVRVVHSIVGCIFRFFAFANIVVSLVLFTCLKKNGFHRIDVRITYCLLYGAIALDAIALFRAVFSDWTVVTIKNIKKRSKMAITYDKLFGARFLSIMDKRKHLGVTKCQIGNDSYDVYDTPVLFRRWSETISAYNLLSYCLQECPTRISKPQGCLSSCFRKIISFPCHIMGMAMSYLSSIGESISSCLCLGSVFGGVAHVSGTVFGFITKKMGIADILDETRYVSKNAFIKDLWEFIFKELQDKVSFADDDEMARKICEARGEWVLQDSMGEEEYSLFMQYVEEVEYDHSLLLWHIATEILYNTDENPSHDDWNNRIFSKILSDYMLYLLVKQPKMMSAVAGISQIRYRDTCAEATKFFSRRGIDKKKRKGEEKKEKLKDACNKILEVDTSVKPVDVKGDRSKSVLFDGSILAKQLKNLKKDKWKIMSRVWVELLSYAASHCRAETHAQLLSKGGELVTFVWLLMAHLGIGQKFQINERHARAKLIVGK